MPRLLLALYALVMAPTAFGQSYPIDKGSIILGGSVGFSSQGGDVFESSDGDRLSVLTLSPQFSYFAVPNVAVGANVSFERRSRGNASSTSLTFGPSVGYYFGDPESTVYPFVSGTVGYTRLDDDADGFVYALGGGVVFMLSPSVGLSGQLSYTAASYSVNGPSDNGNVSANILALGFGVTAFIF